MKKIYMLSIYHQRFYIGAKYRNGYYVTQYGPFLKDEAVKYAKDYDGLKRERAVVWNSMTGEDVYKSTLSND